MRTLITIMSNITKYPRSANWPNEPIITLDLLHEGETSHSNITHHP